MTAVGACLITVGTGPSEVVLEDGHVLQAKHAFAVLGKRLVCRSRLTAEATFIAFENQTSGARLLQILDPWNRSRQDQLQGQVDGPQRKLSSRYDEQAYTTEIVPLQLSVPWETACARFEAIYLNWDPALFAHSVTTHMYVLYCYTMSFL